MKSKVQAKQYANLLAQSIQQSLHWRNSHIKRRNKMKRGTEQKKQLPINYIIVFKLNPLFDVNCSTCTLILATILHGFFSHANVTNAVVVIVTATAAGVSVISVIARIIFVDEKRPIFDFITHESFNRFNAAVFFFSLFFQPSACNKFCASFTTVFPF